MPTNTSALARPTRFLPFIVIAALLLYIFFGSGADHSHQTIYPEQPPSQHYLAQHDYFDHPKPKTPSNPAKHNPVDPECPYLPGIDKLYVILKTGASEAEKKLPIHFSTTLKCVPDYVLYSDFDEEVAGHHVYDALDEVNRLIAGENREFDLYRRLKKEGKSAIVARDRGRERESAGWKLDKWKFLPIIEKAWRDRPLAKWFVFVEDDSYISWTNLLYYLSNLSPSDAHYIGAQMQIEETVFAHGGSGFVLSNEAMRLAAQRRRGNNEYYDGFTASHWAGDCVLGQLMDDIGVPVHWAWPNFQGQTPATLGANRAGYQGEVWCNAAISYHHVSANEIEQLYRFERKLEKQPGKDPLTHLMVFKELVLPDILRLAPKATDWDNESEGQQTDLASLTTAPVAMDHLGHCEVLCMRDPDCVQFKVTDGICITGKTLLLGKAAAKDKSVSSGWIPERVQAAVDKMDDCANPDRKVWVLPEHKRKTG